MSVEEKAQSMLSDGESSETPPFERAKKRGRPKGSKNKTKETEPEKAPYVKTEAGVQMSGLLGGVLWSFASPFMGCKQLDDSQKMQLGEVLDPVLYKYLPLLDRFKEETALAMVLFKLYQENHIKEERTVREVENLEEKPNEKEAA